MKQLDAIDKKILQMRDERKSAPATVTHSKAENHDTDINLSNITIIVGGKTLLDQASLKLAFGRKYGLVGRNGIGKTTLLNHLSRHMFEDFPPQVHVLHVEQEIAPDNKAVIDHVLECDSERAKLLEEHNKIVAEEIDKLTPAQREAKNKRLNEISHRLEEIEDETNVLSDEKEVSRRFDSALNQLQSELRYDKQLNESVQENIGEV